MYTFCTILLFFIKEIYMIIIPNITDIDTVYVSNPFDGKPEDTLWSMSLYDAKNNMVKSFIFNDLSENREYVSFSGSSIEDVEEGEYTVKLDSKDGEYSITTRLRIGNISHSNVINSGNTYTNTTIDEDVFYEG